MILRKTLYTWQHQFLYRVKATKLIRDQHSYSVDFWYHTESRGKSPWLHPLQPDPTRTRSEPFLDFHFFFLILNLILCYIIKFIFILCLVAEKTRRKKETSVFPLFDQAQQHARVLNFMYEARITSSTWVFFFLKIIFGLSLANQTENLRFMSY